MSTVIEYQQKQLTDRETYSAQPKDSVHRGRESMVLQVGHIDVSVHSVGDYHIWHEPTFNGLGLAISDNLN